MFCYKKKKKNITLTTQIEYYLNIINYSNLLLITGSFCIILMLYLITLEE